MLDPSRRDFVRLATLAAVGACAGCHRASGDAADDTDQTAESGAGPDTDLPAPEGWTAVGLAANPKLEAVGGFVYLRLTAGKLLVARLDDTPTFLALSAVCTHLGCTVGYRTPQADVYCACHKSVFDTDGSNVSGIAPLPLAAYEVAWDAEHRRVLVHAV